MSHNIIVYSTPTCPYCHMAKDYLASKNIPFIDKNVAIDTAAGEEMVEKTGQMGVPVIEIDGKIIIGFDRVTIDELLK